MGLFKKLLGIGIATKTYQNIYNRPIISPPPGYVVRGMKQKGFGSTWVIKYSKESAMNSTSTFTVNDGTSSVSVGSNAFVINWP